MLSDSSAIAKSPGRGRPWGAVLRSLFCHHQWDTSRSRKGTYVCRACGARKG